MFRSCLFKREAWLKPRFRLSSSQYLLLLPQKKTFSVAYINITKGSVLGKVMCSCQETWFSPGFIANYLGDLGRITLPLALVQEQEAGSLADPGLGFQWTPLQGLAARPEGTSVQNSTLRPTSGDIKALCSKKG